MQLRPVPCLVVWLASASAVLAAPAERITPGAGWTGATVARVHPGPHVDATSIAHWTRVPDQILWREDAQDFELGVIAYHRSRIDHVRFAVDGGPWVAVDEMSVSSQTGHYEYGVRLAAPDFGRGWHEVRAVAVPEAGGGGTERVLTWRFYDGAGERAGVHYEERWVDPIAGADANDGSRNAPFQSVRRAIDDLASSQLGPDGAVVRLADDGPNPIPVGGVTALVMNEIPLTIRPAPGSAPRFGPGSGTGPDALRVARLRLERLDIDLSFPEMFAVPPVSVADVPPSLCFSACHFQAYSAPVDAAGFATLSAYGLRDRIFLEDSVVDAADAYLRVGWMRGVTIRGLVGTVRARCAIDSRHQGSLDVSGSEASFTLDGPENCLADALRVLDAAVYLSPFSGGATEGTAIVNSVFDGTLMGDGPGYELCTIFHSRREHLLILHSTFAEVPMSFDFYQPFDYDLSNGLVFGSIADYFYDVSRAGLFNNVLQDSEGMLLDAQTVHTAHSKPAWSSWTTGSVDATFVDADQQDFRVRASSPAWGRVDAALAYQRFDADGQLRADPTAVGALKGEGE